MSGIPPVVRHMILCEDARRDPSSPERVNLRGLFNVLETTAEPPFPFAAPPFGVFLRYSGGRGTGNCRITLRHSDTGVIVYATPPQWITFSPDPLRTEDVLVRITGCIFPRPGLYMTQFRFEKLLIAQEPLLLR